MGLCFGIFGAVLNVLATSYGDLLILSSSSSITLMFNGIYSRIILKENFSLRYDGLAMFFILTGQTICVIFSKNEDDEVKKNPNIEIIDKNMFKLIFEPASLIFVTFVLIIIISTVILNKHI